MATAAWITFKHLLMPAIALGFSLAAVTTRITRSSMVEALTQDYIETARAKGSLIAVDRAQARLPQRADAGHHRGRIAIRLPARRRGAGRLHLRSRRARGSADRRGAARDYPVVQGMTIFIAALFIVINLVVDVLYGIVDPRVRYGGRA